MIYYTADLHFCHKGVILMNNRPFEDVEKMNTAIVDNYNKIVSNNDTVYILGDIGFPKNQTQVDDIIDLVKRLKGKKILIVGNHDHKLLKREEFINSFIEIAEYKSIMDGDRRVILFHYPIAEWDGYFRDAVHLHGHIHNNNCDLIEHKNRFNVGIDVQDFKPVTLTELLNGKPKL